MFFMRTHEGESHWSKASKANRNPLAKTIKSPSFEAFQPGPLAGQASSTYASQAYSCRAGCVTPGGCVMSNKTKKFFCPQNAEA